MINEKAILVKDGTPISFHGIEKQAENSQVNKIGSTCKHCEIVDNYYTFECKHPDNNGKDYDFHEYHSSCRLLDWNLCPLNPKNRELDLYATAVANGFSKKQAADMAKWDKSEFVSRINDMMPCHKRDKKIWVFKVKGKGQVSIC